MPAFEYKARDNGGKLVQGVLVAESSREVLLSLDRQGLFPIEICEERTIPGRRARKDRRIRPAEIANLTQEMADLLGAGMPVDRALEVIATNTSNARLAGLIDDVRKQVSRGIPLHKAMAAHPRYFPPAYVGMVRAAETGGFLVEALQRIAAFQQKDEDLKSRVRSALAYPCLLLCLGTGAVIFLLTWFVPKLTTLFQSFGKTLPGITQLLIDVSNATREFWWAWTGAGAAVAGLIAFALSTERGRRQMHKLILGVPVLGEVVRLRAMARFTRTLGSMIQNGVPILEGLATAKDSMGNLLLQDCVEEAVAAVRRGERLGKTLARSPEFPPVLTGMISVGEESGNLDTVLLRAADAFEQKVDRTVKVFVSLFEPLLLVFMAFLIGLIVIAMLYPVFTLSGSI